MQNGKMRTKGLRWEISGEVGTAFGHLERLNAVFTEGARKLAHVSIVFPSVGLSLPLVMPYSEFQSYLPKVD